MTEPELKRPWVVELSSFAGIVALATHYYANLIDPDGAKHRCSYEMTAEHVEAFKEPDFAYEVGTTCERYLSRGAAIRAAMEEFEQRAEGPTVLLLGQSHYEPALVVHHVDLEPWRIAELNDIYAQAEKDGGYEGRNGDHFMRLRSEAFNHCLAAVGLKLNDDHLRGSGDV